MQLVSGLNNMSEIEHERLMSQHRGLVAVTSGRVFHAPVVDPKTVVDLGCGTAILTRELADRFASAQVYGVDLSKVPVNAAFGHTNIKFIQGNMKELLADKGETRLQSVDYAFQRLLLLGMTDWPGHVKAVANSLRSGGWVEMQDYSWEIWEDGKDVSSEWQWQERMIEAGWKRKGIDMRCGQKIPGWMRDAGLLDVQSITYRCPWGLEEIKERPDLQPWADYIQNWWTNAMYIMMPMVMGTDNTEQIEVMAKQMVKDLEASWTQRKGYLFTISWGRKA